MSIDCTISCRGEFTSSQPGAAALAVATAMISAMMIPVSRLAIFNVLDGQNYQKFK
jgi:hypothetical protein